MMNQIKATCKFSWFLLCLCLYTIIALPVSLFVDIFPFASRKILIKNISITTWLVSKGFNLDIEVTGQKDLFYHHSPYLIVSNHLSYLDILVLSSQKSACFVTSVEIKETPFLGHICKLGGCLFVERRNKDKLGQEVKELEDALRNGLSIGLFPEATSTDGTEVLRFKRPLFKAAIETNTPILPISINYLSINNEKMTKSNRDSVCWYGDMSFFPHFWNFLCSGKVKAQIVVDRPIMTSRSDDTTSLSEKSHSKVSKNFRPFV